MTEDYTHSASRDVGIQWRCGGDKSCTLSQQHMGKSISSTGAGCAVRDRAGGSVTIRHHLFRCPLIFSNISAAIEVWDQNVEQKNLHSHVQLSPVFCLSRHFEKKHVSSIIWPLFLSCTDMVWIPEKNLTKEKEGILTPFETKIMQNWELWARISVASTYPCSFVHNSPLYHAGTSSVLIGTTYVHVKPLV